MESSSNGPRKPEGPADHSHRVQQPQDKVGDPAGPVSSVDPARQLPKEGQYISGPSLQERNATVAGQQISPEMQKHLNAFSLNGSASSLLSLLNGQQGLKGQFQIVFKPNDGGQPIPYDQFSKHPDILQAYQNVQQQIAQNHQSIAYGLTHDMARQQQEMASLALSMQQMEHRHDADMALMKALMSPVVHPMSVPLDYLLGFKGTQVPQLQQNSTMGWGGMPGATAPQPGWAPYPQQMHGAQQSAVYPALQPGGFGAMPAAPPQTGMGLQVPFSPWGWYAQQNPLAGAGYAGQLQQFAQAPVPSVIPPWSWQPPVIINNRNGQQPQGRTNPVSGAGASPTINVEVNPVINNGAPSDRVTYPGSSGHDSGYDTDRNKGMNKLNGELWNKLDRIKDLLGNTDRKPIDNGQLGRLKNDIDNLKKIFQKHHDRDLEADFFDGREPRRRTAAIEDNKRLLNKLDYFKDELEERLEDRSNARRRTQRRPPASDRSSRELLLSGVESDVGGSLAFLESQGEEEFSEGERSDYDGSANTRTRVRDDSLFDSDRNNLFPESIGSFKNTQDKVKGLQNQTLSIQDEGNESEGNESEGNIGGLLANLGDTDDYADRLRNENQKLHQEKRQKQDPETAGRDAEKANSEIQEGLAGIESKRNGFTEGRDRLRSMLENGNDRLNTLEYQGKAQRNEFQQIAREKFQDTKNSFSGLQQTIKNTEQLAKNLDEDVNSLLNEPSWKSEKAKNDLLQVQGDVKGLSDELLNIKSLTEEHKKKLNAEIKEINESLERNEFDKANTIANKISGELNENIIDANNKVKNIIDSLSKAGIRLDDIRQQIMDETEESISVDVFNDALAAAKQAQERVKVVKAFSHQLDSSVAKIFRENPLMMDSMKSDFDKSKERIDQIKVTLGDTTLKIDECIQKVGASSKALQQVTIDNGDIKQANVKATEDASRAISELAEADKAINENEKKLKGIESDISFLLNKMGLNFNNRISGLNDDFDKTNSRIIMLQGKIKDSNDVLYELDDDIERLSENDNEIKYQFDILKNKLVDVAAATAGYKDTLQSALESVKQISDDKGDIKEACNDADKKIKEINENLTKTEEERETIESEREKLEVKIKELKSQITVAPSVLKLLGRSDDPLQQPGRISSTGTNSDSNVISGEGDASVPTKTSLVHSSKDSSSKPQGPLANSLETTGKSTSEIFTEFDALSPVPKPTGSTVQLEGFDNMGSTDTSKRLKMRVRGQDDLDSVDSISLDQLGKDAESLSIKISQGLHIGMLNELLKKKGNPENPLSREIQSLMTEIHALEEDWNKALRDISDIEQPEPGDISEEFPPDYISEAVKKKEEIDKFMQLFDKRFVQANKMLTVARGRVNAENKKERVTPEDLDDLEKATIDCFSMIKSCADVYHEKYKKTARTIYKSCYEQAASLDNIYRQYETNNLVKAFPTYDSFRCSDEKDAVKSMEQKIQALINSGDKIKNGGKRTEDIIIDYFKEPRISSGKIWDSLHNSLLKPIFDNADKDHNPEVHPHTRGYMAGRAVQEMCLAIDAHMNKFADELPRSDDGIYELRQSYQALINNMRPENWGRLPSGGMRANYISDGAKKYIKKALLRTQKAVVDKFSGYSGSELAITFCESDQYGEKVKLFETACNRLKSNGDSCSNAVDDAHSLIKDNPEFAKRWFEISLAIFEMNEISNHDKEDDGKAYLKASQREVVSLLQEFKINKQIPVSALILATLKDISKADSTILPCLKTHYFKDSAKRNSSDTRADKYARKIKKLFEKECSYKNIEVFLRGMTFENGKIIPHYHKQLLDYAPDSVSCPQPEGEAQKSDVTIHCELLRPVDSTIRGKQYHSTGEIFASPPMFKRQGLSLKTNDKADPIEIVGIRGSTWKVSPKILLNNPSVKIPFSDQNDPNQQSCGFIPISNTERTVGNESEAILVPDGAKSLLLFTLTDEKNWRCRPVGKDLTPKDANTQKYNGYASLAMAFSAAPKIDEEAIGSALAQAYKAWRHNKPKGDENQFVADMGMRLKEVKDNSKWINARKKQEVQGICNHALERLHRSGRLSTETSATALSEASGFEVDDKIDDVNPQIHMAIIQLKDKLAGKRKKDKKFKGEESAFAKLTADEKEKYFVKASLSASFKLCDQAFIEQLREEMPKAQELFGFMEGRQDSFSQEFLSTLVGYKGALIDPDMNSTSLSDNIDALDMLISKLEVQKSNLEGASDELYEKIGACLQKADINVKDVDDAKKLWIQGRIPEALGEDEKNQYKEWMAQLTQVTWAANRVHCHVKQLINHRSGTEELQRKKVDFNGKESFKRAACELNVKLAAITASITEMSDFLNNTDITGHTDAATRSLFGFMENRNIQLRRHQMDRVPALMTRQMKAIHAGKQDHLFLMEGTGGGKSLCMEAMVDNALNCLAQKDWNFQLKHPVMIIAPDINAGQLKQTIGLSEQKNDRSLQDMDSVLNDLSKTYNSEKFTNKDSLRKIYNALLGVDRDTPENQLEQAVKENRSACLLSFSAFQQLLHATEAALHKGGLDHESEKLINSIRDRFSDGIIFGDECVSGPAPYTESDEKNIIENIKRNMEGLDKTGVTPESVCKKAIGIMSNCFLFTGLSATKGTAAIGALFSASKTYQSTAVALNENLTSTRLRAFDRLCKAKIIRSHNSQKDMAGRIVENLRGDQGVTILDTVTNRDSNDYETGDFNTKLTKNWETDLRDARVAKAGSAEKAPSFSTGYIAADGKTMLHDPRREAYSAKSTSKLGDPINASDEVSLRASGANFHDNILAYDQGIGSDPIQGKNTAFVIRGVFGALEHGRSDLVEQWAGRGTRASNEPYNRQDIFLTVTKEEIERIKNSYQQKGLQNDSVINSRLSEYERSEEKVEKDEKKLDVLLNSLQNQHAIRRIVNEFKNESLNIQYDQNRNEAHLREAIKVEAQQAAKKLVRKTDSLALDETSKEALEAHLVDYLVSEEEFQLNAHLLLFTELAIRENNKFTAAHESWAFKGDAEHFMEKICGKEELWARNQAHEVRNKYAKDINDFVNKGFEKTVRKEEGYINSQSVKAKEDLVAKTLRAAASLHVCTNKLRSMGGANKQDIKSEEEHLKRKYNGNKDHFLMDLMKKVDDDKALKIQAKYALFKEDYEKYEKSKKVVERLDKDKKDYSNNCSNRESLKAGMVEVFEEALANIPRARIDQDDNDLSLASRVKQGEFRNNLERNLDDAIGKGCSKFDTLDTEKLKNFRALSEKAKREAKEYVEMLLMQLKQIQIISHSQTATVNDTKVDKYEAFDNNELKNLLSMCESFNNRIDTLNLNKTREEFDKLNDSIYSYLTSGISLPEVYFSTGHDVPNQILGAIYQIVKGKEATPSIKRNAHGWNDEEVGVKVGKRSSKLQKLYSPIEVNKLRNAFSVQLPRGLEEALAAVKKEEGKCEKAANDDAEFAGKLHEKATEIKAHILKNYDDGCLAKRVMEAREKDALREKQEKMRLPGGNTAVETDGKDGLVM